MLWRSKKSDVSAETVIRSDTEKTQLHGKDLYLRSWKLGLVVASLYLGTLMQCCKSD